MPLLNGASICIVVNERKEKDIHGNLGTSLILPTDGGSAEFLPGYRSYLAVGSYPSWISSLLW